jgi:hypothetical protein
MHTPYLRLGTASAAVVLREIERDFQEKGIQNKQQTFPAGQHTDFLVFANFIQENAVILEPTSPGSEVLPSVNITMNEATSNRFLSILSRMVKEHEGVSRQERIFVHRFWSEIQKKSNYAPEY